ncbi:Type I restriction-modification system, restriction subunit R (EC 3.1.21.3), partial [uncultured Gammaproteobacteria bacterium]
ERSRNKSRIDRPATKGKWLGCCGGFK